MLIALILLVSNFAIGKNVHCLKIKLDSNHSINNFSFLLSSGVWQEGSCVVNSVLITKDHYYSHGILVDNQEYVLNISDAKISSWLGSNEVGRNNCFKIDYSFNNVNITDEFLVIFDADYNPIDTFPKYFEYLQS